MSAWISVLARSWSNFGLFTTDLFLALTHHHLDIGRIPAFSALPGSRDVFSVRLHPFWLQIVNSGI